MNSSLEQLKTTLKAVGNIAANDLTITANNPTQHSYLITTTRHRWIAKAIFGSTSQKESIVAQYKQAHQLKLSPALICCTPDLSWVVHEYVSGCTLNLEHLQDPKILIKLSQLLKTTHLHPSPKVEQNSPRLSQRLSILFEKLPKPLLDWACSPYEKTKIIKILSPSAQQPPALCWTHQDFHPNNILIDSHQHIWIVDWNQATNDHPAIDFAMIMQYLAASPLQTWTKLAEENFNITPEGIDKQYHLLTSHCILWALQQALKCEKNTSPEALQAFLDHDHETLDYQHYQQAFLSNTFDYNNWQAWAKLAMANQKRKPLSHLLSHDH